MPLYEYRCADCQSVFALLRSMNDRENRAQCPTCAGATTMPLISRAMARSTVASESGPVAASGGGGGCCGGSCGCG